MKNWKTTLGGLLGGIGAALALAPDPQLHTVGILASAVAVGWLGYHAKDKG